MAKILEGAALFAAMRDNRDSWHETTEAMMDEQLGFCPPTFQSGYGFLVGEPWTHEGGEAVYAAFVELDNRKFAKYMTMRQFSRFIPHANRHELIKESGNGTANNV